MKLGRVRGTYEDAAVGPPLLLHEYALTANTFLANGNVRRSLVGGFHPTSDLRTLPCLFRRHLRVIAVNLSTARVQRSASGPGRTCDFARWR